MTSVGIGAKNQLPEAECDFFFFFFFLKLNKRIFYVFKLFFFFFFFFFAYGKFGSHGLFAIYWILRNNGPRCIGATLYLHNKGVAPKAIHAVIVATLKRMSLHVTIKRMVAEFKHGKESLEGLLL